MHPKIKTRPSGEKPAVQAVRPLVLHEVSQPTASANAASRRRIVPTQPASGRANHARHHVSPNAQS